MEIRDQGVYPPSFMDFTIPSTFAKKSLIHISQYGHFLSDEKYYIERESLNTFLLVLVKSGIFHVRTQQSEFVAPPEHLVFLDCHEAHAYWCTEPTDFWWFHFDGGNTEDYYRFLFEKHGKSIVMINDQPERMLKYFMQIFELLRAYSQNEHMLSLQINKIFAKLSTFEEVEQGSEAFDSVIDFIRKHYGEEISLEDLMEVCGYSKSYFIREFKRKLGSTPHEYLLSYRLRQTKQRLAVSSESVESIAESCGFNSASHFARAFKKETGMTPTEFRSLRF